MTSLTIGSPEHKAEFLAAMKKETAENLWKNELHVLRLQDERSLVKQQLDMLAADLQKKGKPAANVEEKQRFNLERTLEHKDKEILDVESTMSYNSYLLRDLIPRYEKLKDKPVEPAEPETPAKA